MIDDDIQYFRAALCGSLLPLWHHTIGQRMEPRMATPVAITDHARSSRRRRAVPSHEIGFTFERTPQFRVKVPHRCFRSTSSSKTGLSNPAETIEELANACAAHCLAIVRATT
ncbi:hypothetical protein [Nocardia lijiangensis]|uniref:hypothetical protein n=1 Tax=Nocardia lijiangensis TaxID=299618 RepID=UPI0012DD893C|nr:hypothetical protein [Nocardia lijiangensis]